MVFRLRTIILMFVARQLWKLASAAYRRRQRRQASPHRITEGPLTQD